MNRNYFKKKEVISNKVNTTDWRLIVLMLVIVSGMVMVILRLFNLQIVNSKAYALLASDQHEVYKKIFPSRGKIFVRERNNNGEIRSFPLATNKEYALVYAQPKLIEKPEEVAEQIYPLLFKEEIEAKQKEESEVSKSNEKNIQTDDNFEKINEISDFSNDISDESRGSKKLNTFVNRAESDEDFQRLLNKLKKEDDPYEPLKHKVDLEIAKKIDELDINGIGYIDKLWRYYPDGQTQSHILGFVRREDDKMLGQYGLEGHFNDILAGKQGYLHTESGARGESIVFGDMDFVEARNGSDMYLTIDRTIQFRACEELAQAVADYQIETGTIIVMQPKTGALLALCNYPSFDPNRYNEVGNINVFNNQATLSAYEPGSIFKPITMAAAIDLDKVTPYTKYYDEGFVEVDRFTIRNVDSKSNKWQTMTEVLEKSLNTGAIFAAQQVGNEKFLQYVKDFGFGSKTGIKLGSEAIGDIRSLEKLNDVYTFTASFGQGISVTPIQMITAFSAIANDGKLMKPYLVDEIIDPDEKSIKTVPQQVRQVVSPRTATLIKAMLVSVVRNGHANGSGVKGYHLAGKTGTAQIHDSELGGYSEDRFNHSFVGFGPVDDPQFIILIKLTNPQGVRFSSESAAPIFGKLAEFILKYYEIPPDVTLDE